MSCIGNLCDEIVEPGHVLPPSFAGLFAQLGDNTSTDLILEHRRFVAAEIQFEPFGLQRHIRGR